MYNILYTGYGLKGQGQYFKNEYAEIYAQHIGKIFPKWLWKLPKAVASKLQQIFKFCELCQVLYLLLQSITRLHQVITPWYPPE